MAWAILSLSSCTGILSGIYDDPEQETRITRAGQLYLDASDWTQWHYIDFKDLVDKTEADPAFDSSSLWETFPIPMPDRGSAVENTEPAGTPSGIYTYWYDVFGVGIEKREFNSFSPTEKQAEPSKWSIAIHRNNVRTNGGSAWRSPYRSFDEMPSGTDWLDNVIFSEDEWNQTDVWTVQDRMLLGLAGNQGIKINNLLGQWLTMKIPPMPPVFTHDKSVYVLRLSDGSYAALQLADYVNSAGTKCHLTINYRYPL